MKESPAAKGASPGSLLKKVPYITDTIHSKMFFCPSNPLFQGFLSSFAMV